MTETLKPEEVRTLQAWFSVISARDEMLASQDAISDLLELATTEAAKLDSPAYLAMKLAVDLGQTQMSQETADLMYEGLVKFLDAVKIEIELRNSIELEPAPLGENGGKDAAEEFMSLLERCGVDPDGIYSVVNQFYRIQLRGPRSALMAEALLMTSISQYEVFVSQLIAASLRFNPQALKQSGRTFAFAEITSFQSLDEFIEESAQNFADKLMAEPMEKWMAFLSSAVRVDTSWISESTSEIVQRRHIHVHNGGKVSSRYLSNVPSSKAKIGEKLGVTADYLSASLDKLAQAVLFLAQAALHAIRQSDSSTIERLGLRDNSDPIFNLLAAGRFHAIAELHDRMSSMMFDASAREHLKANCLQAQKAIHGLDHVRDDIEAWDISAMSERYTLAKLCLLEELDKAQAIVDSLLASGNMTTIDVATWPILEPLRESLMNGESVEK